MANVVTDDRIGFDRLYCEWLKSLPEAERPAWVSVVGTFRDLRPMFVQVPDALIPFLRSKGFEFDVEN